MQKNNALITDVTNRYSNNSEWTDNVKKTPTCRYYGIVIRGVRRREKGGGVRTHHFLSQLKTFP